MMSRSPHGSEESYRAVVASASVAAGAVGSALARAVGVASAVRHVDGIAEILAWKKLFEIGIVF